MYRPFVSILSTCIAIGAAIGAFRHNVGAGIAYGIVVGAMVCLILRLLKPPHRY